MNSLEFIFDDEPLRLDIAIARLLPHFSRSKIKTLTKSISINGKAAKFCQKVKRGDAVLFEYEDELLPTNKAENVPLDIIYEDENVIVINKKRGMVVHPSPSCVDGTVLNALNYYRLHESKIKDEFSYHYCGNAKLMDAFPKSEADVLRLGIVHRLDRETTGAIITARNVKTQVFLKNEFKCRRVKKIYLALLEGHLKEDEGLIKTSIFRSKANKGRFASSGNLSKGRLAVSRYKVIKNFGDVVLVKFRIYTGRTHQIRVHAKHIGCTIVGDSLYGNKKGGDGKILFTPLCLHAYKIELNIGEGVKKTFIAPLPKDFKKVIKKLKNE